MTEETLLTTKRFHVARVDRELPGGQTISREVIRHPGSVVIVPILDDDRICLIRNYRVAAGRSLVELPAGTLEENEDPAICAARELTEETGYQSSRIEPRGGFYAAPGILDEYMHLFVAHDLTPGPPARELGEEIENLIVSREDAIQMIRDGTICDAKTIVGLLRSTGDN